MHLIHKRWILSPITQWQAHRFTQNQKAGMTVEVAWLLIRLSKNPAEIGYILTHRKLHIEESSGLDLDDWSLLPEKEKRRRRIWLRKHGGSPFQQLGISGRVLSEVGLHVTDWGHPPGDQKASIP
ncbi:hypothetical protein Sm713_16280 [Streptomyces sp. TS71-3]|nr:hypothetical protein Sm713_16280 [Streptomyces sp. TS71-3]